MWLLAVAPPSARPELPASTPTVQYMKADGHIFRLLTTRTSTLVPAWGNGTSAVPFPQAATSLPGWPATLQTRRELLKHGKNIAVGVGGVVQYTYHRPAHEAWY
jgi:hypothetical protein